MRRLAICLLALASAPPLHAQIVLQASEVLVPSSRASGTLWSTAVDDESTAADALAAQRGGGQVWDLSALPLSTPTAAVSPFAVDAMPARLAASAPFATATGVGRQALAAGRTHATYFRLAPDGHLLQLGTFRTAPAETAVQTSFEPDGLASLAFPLREGDTWTGAAEARSDAPLAGVHVELSGSVVGWGVLRLPAGEFDALMIETTVTAGGGRHTSLAWVTREGHVAGVDPDPTTGRLRATVFLRQRVAVGAADSESADPLVVTAAPNPSAGVGGLVVWASAPGPARVTIYDMAGREAAPPFEAALAAGETRLDLAAARLPSGSYLVRVEHAGEVRTARLTLAR